MSSRENAMPAPSAARVGGNPLDNHVVMVGVQGVVPGRIVGTPESRGSDV